MSIKQAENLITAAAHAGIRYEDTAELVQQKLHNSGQQKFTSDQWSKLLQLWECETALNA